MTNCERRIRGYAVLLFGMLPGLLLAEVRDFRIASWNMQGATQGAESPAGRTTESKWSVFVRQMLRQVDVLALQESGQVPATAEATGRVFPVPGSARGVQEYTWRLGSHWRAGQVRYIYHLDMDGRVSMATVTHRIADEVVVLPNLQAPNGRPLFGVGFNRAGGGRDVFFNVHAQARDNNEAPAMVDAVQRHYAGQANVEWMVLGDYNMPPNTLRRSLTARFPQTAREVTAVHVNGSGTHERGGNLDYAVVGQGSAGPAASATTLFARLYSSFQASDHSAVAYGSAD